MPASFVAEILSPVFEVIFGVAGYYVGRVVVPIISFGRWKCDPLLRQVPKAKLKWGGFYHRRGQRVYLTAESTILVGILFCGLVVTVLLLWFFKGD